MVCNETTLEGCDLSSVWTESPAKDEWFRRLGYMFYLARPEDTTFHSPDQVPHYFTQAWPFFLTFIILENLVLWYEKKPTMRLNDGMTSISHGIMQECARMVFRGSESALYIWVYENYRLVDLDWSSPFTWYLTALAVDFLYYWMHRACHEVHVLWAQHQVHHSSEDFNLAVGLRQSALQGWCGFIFYVPLAVAIPPSLFLTHQQFCLLYQFWIHTETISSLGPLEYLLNTPRHHRVHHGSVLYCLDKNYGGTLIIWDRLFGTFAEENPKQEMIYGLVMNQPSFNPLFLQVFYNMNVYNKVMRMDNWRDRVSAVVKGPSWLPGRPWTGCEEDKIDVKSRKKYDVKLPSWCNFYLLLHFIAVLISFHDLTHHYVRLSAWSGMVCVAYLLVTLTSLGLMLENRPGVFLLEMVRCAALAWVLRAPALPLSLPLLHWFFTASAAFWALHCLNLFQVTLKS